MPLPHPSSLTYTARKIAMEFHYKAVALTTVLLWFAGTGECQSDDMYCDSFDSEGYCRSGGGPGGGIAGAVIAVLFLMGGGYYYYYHYKPAHVGGTVATKSKEAVVEVTEAVVYDFDGIDAPPAYTKKMPKPAQSWQNRGMVDRNETEKAAAKPKRTDGKRDEKVQAAADKNRKARNSKFP